MGTGYAEYMPTITGCTVNDGVSTKEYFTGSDGVLYIRETTQNPKTIVYKADAPKPPPSPPKLRKLIRDGA
jgi:hypothetical protein